MPCNRREFRKCRVAADQSLMVASNQDSHSGAECERPTWEADTIRSQLEAGRDKVLPLRGTKSGLLQKLNCKTSRPGKSISVLISIDYAARTHSEIQFPLGNLVAPLSSE